MPARDPAAGARGGDAEEEDALVALLEQLAAERARPPSLAERVFWGAVRARGLLGRLAAPGGAWGGAKWLASTPTGHAAIALTALTLAAAMLAWLLLARVDLHDLLARGATWRLVAVARLNRLRPASRLLDVDAPDGAGRTPLHAAAGAGAAGKPGGVAAVRALLAAGAQVATRDDAGNTPLHVAVKAATSATTSANAVAAAAAARGGDGAIDALSSSSATHTPPLLGELEELAAGLAEATAATEGQLQRELNDEAAAAAQQQQRQSAGGGVWGPVGRAAIALASCWRATARRWAAVPPQQAIVASLLAAGADPLAPNWQGRTPVHVAAAEQCAEAPFLGAVQTLLQAAVAAASAAAAETAVADPPVAEPKVAGTTQPPEGESAATAAQSAGDAAAVWAVLTRGDAGGATPLHLASKPEVLALLLGHLASAASSDGAGATAAALAVRDHAGLTPLLAACRDGRSRVLPLLVTSGADVAAVDPRTWLPAAHLAATVGKASGVPAAEALLTLADGGADLCATLPAPVDAGWFTQSATAPERYDAARAEEVAALSTALPAQLAAGDPLPQRAFPVPGAPRQAPVARYAGCTPLSVAAATLPVGSLRPLARAARHIGIDVNGRDAHGATPAGVAALFADRGWHGHASGRLFGVLVDKLRTQLHVAADANDAAAISAWITRPHEQLAALIEAERAAATTPAAASAKSQADAQAASAAAAGKAQPYGGLSACPVTGRSGGYSGASACPFANQLAAEARKRQAEVARAAAVATAVGLPPTTRSSNPPVAPPAAHAHGASTASSAPASAAPSSASSGSSGDDPTHVAPTASGDEAGNTATTTSSSSPQSGDADASPQPPQPSAVAAAVTAALRKQSGGSGSGSGGHTPSESLLRSVGLSLLSRADIAKLVRRVNADAMLHSQDWMGMTPLHAAAWRGHAEAVRALLEGGADRDARGVGPLQLPPLGAAFLRFATHRDELDAGREVAYGRQFAAAQALLEAGASLSRCLVTPTPPRECASNTTVVLPPHVRLWCEHRPFLLALLRAAAGDCAAVDEYGNTLLHVLLYAGLPKTAGSAVRLLLAQAQRQAASEPADKDDDDASTAAAATSTLRAFLCVRNSVGHSVLSLLASSGVPGLQALAAAPPLAGLCGSGAPSAAGAYARSFSLHAACAAGDAAAVAGHLHRVALAFAASRAAVARLRRELAAVGASLPGPAAAVTSTAVTASVDGVPATTEIGTSATTTTAAAAAAAGDSDAHVTAVSPAAAAAVARVEAVCAQLAAEAATQAALMAELEGHDDTGRTPLGVAAEAGATSVVALLLTGELPDGVTLPTTTSANTTSNSGTDAATAVSLPPPPLRLPRVAVEGRCTVFRHGQLLVMRPLGLAAASGHADVVSLLLDAGAEALAPNDAAVPDRECYREQLPQPPQEEAPQQQAVAAGGDAATLSSGGGGAVTAPSEAGFTAAKRGGSSGKKKGGGKPVRVPSLPSLLTASGGSPTAASPSDGSAHTYTTGAGASGAPVRDAYVKVTSDAVALAGLAGHEAVVRVFLRHPAVTVDFDDDGCDDGAGGGGRFGPYAQSLGWAAAYAAREGHAAVAALLLPLAASEPGCFVLPSAIPGRGFRVSPASFAAPPVRDAVARALMQSPQQSQQGEAVDETAATPGADGGHQPQQLALALGLPLPDPAQRAWLARHAHRTLLGYALVDDDPARLLGWLSHAAVAGACDTPLVVATAVQLGSPRVAAALAARCGSPPFSRDAHRALVLLTGCGARKLACIGSVKQESRVKRGMERAAAAMGWRRGACHPLSLSRLVCRILPAIHARPLQVAALLASGAAQLSDPFFPSDEEGVSGSGEGGDSATTARVRLTSRLAGLLRLGGRGASGAGAGAVDVSAGGTTAAAAASGGPPWEFTPADVAALRAAARGGRARRHDRQLGATVSLPFGGAGGALLLGGAGTALGSAVPLSLPGTPAALQLTTADAWAHGFAVSADEFDYTTDVRTGDALSGVLVGALASFGGGGGGAAADGGSTGTASAEGGGSGGELPRVAAGAVAAALGMTPRPSTGGGGGGDGDSVADGLHSLLGSVGGGGTGTGGGGGSLFTPLDCLHSE